MTGAPVAAEHPLRRARLRRGMTQVELAGLAGLASSYISMIERGRGHCAGVIMSTRWPLS